MTKIPFPDLQLLAERLVSGEVREIAFFLDKDGNQAYAINPTESPNNPIIHYIYTQGCDAVAIAEDMKKELS